MANPFVFTWPDFIAPLLALFVLLRRDRSGGRGQASKERLRGAARRPRRLAGLGQEESARQREPRLSWVAGRPHESGAAWLSRRRWVAIDKENRWVARLRPGRSTNVDALLRMPLGLDVWERRGEVLLVAASELQLSELERRRLAEVERLSTVAEFEAQAQRRAEQREEGDGVP
jgi:hypothetical protein